MGCEDMDKKEILDRARELMKGCHVCRECNGVACRGEIPGFGGVRTGATFIRNVQALKEYGLIMRSMTGVDQPDTSTVIFGRKLELPVLLAPIGGFGMNFKIDKDPKVIEKEYCEAITKGSLDAGTLAFTCFASMSQLDADSSIISCKAYPGLTIPTIKPHEDDDIIAKAKWAEAAGAFAIACDIDAAALVNMRLTGTPVCVKSAASIKKIASALRVPFIVKGIMSKEEALLCYEAGAKGIVVSNHGGRIIDGMAGTTDVLPEIAEAVKGKLTIFIDGGIRTGEDVLKVLALGADAVLVGRPISVAAIGGGAEGVKVLLHEFKQSLSDAMMITGVPTVQAANSSILKRL